MILRSKGIIFIHIPKCAGTSVEKFLGGQDLVTHDTNYELALGWCPNRRIHMQHAKPDELIDLKLITELEWNEMHSFAVVRNPYEKLVSGYSWIKKNLKIEGSLEQYILKQGDFTPYFIQHKKNPLYRGEHLDTQQSFVYSKSKGAIDEIIPIEQLNKRLNHLAEEFDLDASGISHTNKSNNNQTHYSWYFTDDLVSKVEELYGSDLEELSYSFEDRRAEMTAADRNQMNKIVSN